MDSMFLEDFSFIENYDILQESVGGERKYFLRGVFSRVNKPNKNKRIYTEDVMRESINSISDVIKSRGLVGELDHPCLISNDFDVLSEEGWKPFTELKVGDKVATFDENNVIENQEIQTVIDEPFKGKVYHFKGRNIDTTVTGAHRFYLEDRYGKREVVMARDIYANRKKYNHSKIIKIGSWTADTKEEWKIGDDVVQTKDFMAFMGIYLAEGSVTRAKKNLVSIHQNEGETADKIRELLDRMGFKYNEYYNKRPNTVQITFSIKNKALHDYVEVLGKCYDKYIPYELKQFDAPYLEELLDWYILGDGRDQRHYEGSNRRNLFSVSKKLVEDLHEILIKTGGSGNWTEYNIEDDYMFAEHLIEAKNKSTLYQLNISTTKGIYLDERFLTITEKEYEGNIYCLTVGNGNFYMKQNGKAFLTGNSSIKINVKGISHVITNLDIAPDGAVLGEAEALETEPGMHLRKLMEAKVRLGVSTRGSGSVSPYSGPLGEGLVVVKPGYKMRAIDIVFDPSAEAYPNYFKEDTDESVYLGQTASFRKVWDDVFGGKR